jgi:hypothetical protein
MPEARTRIAAMRVVLSVIVAALALSVAGPAPARTGVLVKAWFPQGKQLRYGLREVDQSSPLVPAAIRELLAGPTVAETRAGARTAFVPGTRLLGFRRGGSSTTIQLDALFLEQNADSQATVAPARLAFRLLQLGRTLDQFAGIHRFRISVSGRLLTAYPELGLRWKPSPDGWWDLTKLVPTAAPALKVRLTAGDLEQPGEVRLAQTILARTGWLDPAEISGQLDYATSQAVMAFEAWHDLTRDGLLTTESFAAILHATRPEARLTGPGRHVEIYRSIGVLLMVQDGVVVGAVHASTGAPGRETPAGTFDVYRKEQLSWSIQFKVWMPWASYFTGGIAMHAYPDVPAYPASHGCVRLSAPEAQRVYDFAIQGTPVDVY